MQPRYILGLVRKWLWLIILAALLGGAVGASVDHVLPKQYEAQATLFVNSPNHLDYNSVLGDQQAARALALFPQSNQVLQATLQSLHITDLTLPQLTSMVTVQNDLNSQFVIVQVRDRNPQRAALLASEIAKLSLAQFQSTTINSTGAQYVREQIRNIPKEISQLEQKLSSLEAQSVYVIFTPQQTAQINQLQASIASLQASYIDYVNTYDSLNSIQVNLLQDAQVPQKPVGGGAVVAIAIGLLVGLIAIMGVIIFIEQTDDILRSPAKVEKAAGLRTLITVRHLHITTNRVVLLDGHNLENDDTITLKPIAAKARGAHLIEDEREMDDTAKRLAIATRQVQSISSDSQMSRRTSTGFQVPQTFLTLGVLLRGERSPFISSSNNNRSLLISSPEDGNGKTFIASQLALGLARVGVEVVLVDANLNKPEIHRIFGLPNRIGLGSILSSSPNGHSTSYLVDQTFSALQETHEPKLSVLTSGPAVDSSPEILASSKMTSIINLLSEKAFVVIDGPAVLTSSESVILANKSDAILIVADARHTTASKLNMSLEMLTWVNTNILGVVLNQVSKGNENKH